MSTFDMRISLAGDLASRLGVLVLPGFNNSGEIIAEALEDHLANVLIVGVDLPVSWGNPGPILEHIIHHLPQKVTHWVIYGHSMGGMLAVDLLLHPASPFTPETTVLVMDGSPSGGHTLNTPPLSQWLSRHWKGGPITEALYAAGVKAMRKRQPWPGVQAGGNARLVDATYDRLMHPNITSVTSQMAYMSRYRRPIANDPHLEGYLLCYIDGPDGHDTMVDATTARAEWFEVFGPKYLEVIDQRQPGEHASVVERPGGVAAVIAECLSVSGA